MAKQTAVAKSGHAVAASVSDGKTHIAGVKALRVMLCEDDGGWFAQGLEIDYFASGATLKEAKANFAEGLVLTTNEHLLLYGNLRKLLVLAPQDAWDEYYKTPAETLKTEALNFVTFVSVPDSEKAVKVLPFEGMQFIPSKHHTEPVAVE